MRAGFEALAAPDAFGLAQENFGLWRNRLRVMAPPALQRAAFEKHRRADARAVLQAIMLNMGEKCRQMKRYFSDFARGPLFYLFLPSRTSETNFAILSMAISILCRLVAKQQRRNPSPLGPNALPGIQATFFSFTSRPANSLEESPVEAIDGKA